MSKKTDLLRSALREVRVKEPLHLLRNGPILRPPTTTLEPNLNEAPHLEVTSGDTPRIEVPHQEEPSIQASHRKDAQNEIAHFEAPHFDEAHKEQPQFEQPKLQPARDEVTQLRGGCDPEEAVNEPAQNERGARGFFRLSERAFSHPKLQQLSGDCFRLFLWMSARGWRYQNSDGTLRASVSFIETHTGMSHATISRGLKSLKELSLLELRQVDYKRGNIWRVSAIAFGGATEDPNPPKRKQKHREAGSTLGASEGGAGNLKSSPRPPQNEQHIKNIKINKTTTTSQSSIPRRVKDTANKSDLNQTPAEAPKELAVKKFESELPAEVQTSLISSYAGEHFCWGFSPSPRLVLELTALRWFETVGKGTIPEQKRYAVGS